MADTFRQLDSPSTPRLDVKAHGMTAARLLSVLLQVLGDGHIGVIDGLGIVVEQPLTKPEPGNLLLFFRRDNDPEILDARE